MIENDEKWKKMNRLRIEQASQNKWASYSMATLDMADLLMEERKYQSAIEQYLELLYLDICGTDDFPNFVGVKPTQEDYKRFKPFDLALGFIPPAILSYIKICVKDGKLNISGKRLKEFFIERNNKIYSAVKILPVEPSKAWRLIISFCKKEAKSSKKKSSEFKDFLIYFELT